MGKPTILIITNTISRGGAEIMLLGILKELNTRYSIILVTLLGIYKDEIDESELEGYTYYDLKLNSLLKFFTGIFRLRKIIKKHKVNLVHAHLYQSILLARIATPRSIPFLFSVHSQLSRFTSFPQKVLEKVTLRKSDVLIAVSDLCKNDYLKHFGKVHRHYVLHNYVDPVFFQTTSLAPKAILPLKIIAVGNVKAVKNYRVLIQAFRYLKDKKLILEIYGRLEQPLFDELNSLVKKEQAPVTFKGITHCVNEAFCGYHLFVSSSLHEGFGMTVIEAMASGLPVLLSDIPVFREITQNNALFFDNTKPESFAQLVQEILDGKNNLQDLSDAGRKIAENYTKEKYLEKLFRIYDENLK